MSDLTAMIKRFDGREGMRKLVNVLKQQELISNDRTIARNFALAAKVRAVEEGKDLYVQGQAGRNSVFFLLSGKLRVLVNENCVRIASAGEMVGEFPILEPALAHAVTMRAAEDSLLAVVPERAFLAIARKRSKVWENMARMGVRRLYHTTRIVPPAKSPCVFIGHGNSRLWEEVETYIAKQLHVRTVTYESANCPGKTVKEVLEKMLAEATFAVIVMTAEDRTPAGTRRARQNVVHEAGYFQGVLGFDRAVMLVESRTEAFSNITGVQFIAFERNAISTAFPKLKRALDTAGLLAKESAANAG